jgi:hypothetical protein
MWLIAILEFGCQIQIIINSSELALQILKIRNTVKFSGQIRIINENGESSTNNKRLWGII